MAVELSLAADAELVRALQSWQQRLTAAGLACRAVACHGADARWQCPFPLADSALDETWAALRGRVSGEQPVALGKVGAAAAADLLMATALQLPGGQPGVVGVLLAPPHNERSIQQVLLALGWLQLSLAVASLVHHQRAARLLELIGHVASQQGARAAAQEWVNRSAAWVRDELAGARASPPSPGDPGGPPPAAAAPDAGFTLVLFEQRGSRPHWWVAADTAWAEPGAPLVQEAAEVAARAAVEMQPLQHGRWWALPLLDQGRVVAVLLAGQPGAGLPDAARAVLVASAALAEPLLRHWRDADRALPLQVLAAARRAWRRLTGPGHLAWKAGALGLGVALALLLLWPVPERVSASMVIEGRTRQLVTAPFDGFIAAVAVRPGEAVRRGQLLARLDDRELKLEQGKARSEREQSAAKLRQAMADRDAAALALAQADVRQADAQLALVEAKLARAPLLAPLDGQVVTGDWVQHLGSPVEIGKELFEIAATDGYRVVLHVPERDIARVQPGQSGVLRLAGAPHTGWPFVVSRVTATASVQDGINGFRVEATWQGEAPRLSPGMQGVGKVEVGRASLLSVWTRPSVDWLRMKLWTWW